VRRRLVLTYLAMLAVVLVVLEVPLAVSYAQRQQQQLYLQRLSETARFASLAGPVLAANAHPAALQEELERFDRLSGVAVAVADRRSGIRFASRPGLRLNAAVLSAHIESRAGSPIPSTNGIPWPWENDPLVLAQPIAVATEPLGAAVTISPTDNLRATVSQRWMLLGLGGLLALLFSPLAALPLGRWILRPVADLDNLAQEIAEGKLDARVAATGGPPELQRLAHSFNEMVDTVKASLEQQKAFVADASHQLRNPLTALRLRVENLEPMLNSEGQEELTLEVEEADRLSNILDNLLTLARAEQSEQPLETVDVGEVVDGRVEAWRAAAESKSVFIQRSGSERVRAEVLPSALDRTLDALLDNALKFAPEGTSIDVCVVTYATQVDVHVVDQGPGLTTMERERATQRFWRDRHQQNKKGSGLGLAIASALIAASGGKLDLLDNSPTGLDVRIRLTSDPELAKNSARRAATSALSG
jgi:signal transduction histidine kinase